MLILVAYDVSTDTPKGRRRLRRVAKVCLTFGQRVQKSVFECNVDKATYVLLEKRLLDEIDPAEDYLRLYQLSETAAKNVKEFGQFRSVNFDGPLVV